MTRQRVLLFLLSLGLGVVLMIVLVRLARLDMSAAFAQVRAAKAAAIARLVLLNVVLVLLSTEKWRSVDSALRSSSDAVPSKAASFVLTSIGMALGFVLPVQFGMAAARTLGTYFYGKPFKRGMAGSLFEQSFDVLIVGVLALASGFTLLIRAQARAWMVSAVVAIALTWVLAGIAMRILRGVAGFLSEKMLPTFRISAGLRRLSELEDSGVLGTTLARRLVVLSSLRFGVVVLIAGQTAAAVSARIELWHLAAAMPLVVLATALAITPGGIGVTELTYAGGLSLFGTPVSAAAEWAVANRVLCIASSFAVALCATLIFATVRLFTPRKGMVQASNQRSG